MEIEGLKVVHALYRGWRPGIHLASPWLSLSAWVTGANLPLSLAVNSLHSMVSSPECHERLFFMRRKDYRRHHREEGRAPSRPSMPMTIR